MDAQNKPGSLLPVSSFFFAFLALGLVLVTDTPFKGTRPDIGEFGAGLGDGVRARLWEDPFSAVERYLSGGNDGAGVAGEHASCEIVRADGSRQVAEAHTLADLRCQILRAAQGTGGQAARLTVLAAPVFGGAYQSAIERRMRSRYAVLSALGASGYVPQDVTRISFLDFSAACGDRDTDASVLCSLPGIVPYEWLLPSRPGNADAVLLLWFDDDELGRHAHPLETLAGFYRRVGQSLVDDRQSVTLAFKILGPAGSGNLRNIYAEKVDLIRGDVGKRDAGLADYMRDIPIYSPSATVDKRYILDNLARRIDQLRGFDDLTHTITTDLDHAQALVCELQRRGVDLVCPFGDRRCRESLRTTICGSGEAPGTPAAGDRPTGEHRAHAVLIGEWDTYYGRMLPRAFEDAIRSSIGRLYPDVPADELAALDTDWLHPFTYLRGLDGKVPGLKDEAASAGNAGKTSKQNAQAYGADIRQPVGRNQFDYLRRLAGRLVQLDGELRAQGKGAIRAVGVLGSDEYDKLLVLQALRKRFPGVVFFTTDLDSRLLHPAELDWARNLVIASGYGLSLHPRLQRGVPPFRDGYQTSLFLATLLAVGNGGVFGESVTASQLQACLQPRIFEVGQTGAVDLSVNGGDAQACSLTLADQSTLGSLYPERSPPQLAGGAILAVLLVVTLLVVWGSRFTHSLRNGMAAVAVALLLGLLLWTGYVESRLLSEAFSGEPFSFADGVSIWPTELLRLASALLSVFFIAVVVTRLQDNAREIAAMFDLQSPQWQGLTRLRRASCDSGAQPAPPTLYARLCRIAQHLLLLDWGMRTKPGQREDFRAAWSEYLDLSYGWSWLARLIALLVAFLLLAGTIMSVFGPPQTPFRGEVSRLFDRIAVFLAVVTYLVLVFRVFDASRLARRFIHLLMSARIGWPRGPLEKTRDQFGLPSVVAAEHLRLRVIQKHVAAIDPMIFYPFAVMFVMILSRSRFFDDWHFPLSLVIVIGLSGLFALSSAFLLRRAARQAKETVLANLQNLLMMARACEAQACDDDTRRCMQIAEAPETASDATTPPPKPPVVKVSDRIGMMIDEVNALRSGPFAPLAKHPIFSALAMPFGGVGGLYLIDYFATMNW